MRAYRLRDLEVEAVQWTGENLDDVNRFMPAVSYLRVQSEYEDDDDPYRRPASDYPVLWTSAWSCSGYHSFACGTWFMRIVGSEPDDVLIMEHDRDVFDRFLEPVPASLPPESLQGRTL